MGSWNGLGCPETQVQPVLWWLCTSVLKICFISWITSLNVQKLKIFAIFASYLPSIVKFGKSDKVESFLAWNNLKGEHKDWWAQNCPSILYIAFTKCPRSFLWFTYLWVWLCDEEAECVADVGWICWEGTILIVSLLLMLLSLAPALLVFRPFPCVPFFVVSFRTFPFVPFFVVSFTLVFPISISWRRTENCNSMEINEMVLYIEMVTVNSLINTPGAIIRP